MSRLQRLGTITETTANLIAQLQELNELREQVRKAELSAWRPRPKERKKITFNRNAPTVSGIASSTVSAESIVGK